MSKLTSIATYSVFNRLWEDNQINDSSLIFILDTGQLYTHGMFINGAIFGSATTQAVPLTIAGSTYTLSLSSHTHSNYLEKNTDIDITGNKITSDNIDVLYYSGGGLYFGDSNTPIYVSGSLNTFRNNTVYDVLDTGNFSVSTTLPTGHVLSNTAYIQYGSSSFQIDYVKRVNTSQSFDYLNSYTQAGTTLLNGKYYGYITLYTDTVFTNPAWAQMRIDISGRTLEYRTSANPNSWINLNTPEVQMNALNVAGLVAAPTSTTINKVWKTDGEGNPGWRDEASYTFASLKFQQISGTDLMTYNTQAAKTILAGSNISFTHENGVLTIKAQDTTYGVVSKTSAGLAPQLPNEETTTKFLRQDGTWATPTYTSDTNTWREIKVNGTQKRSTAITSGDLNFINGSNTTVEWTSDNKLKINSTWTAWKGATDSANGTAGYMPAPTSAQRGQFLRGDGSWVSLNNYSLPTASKDTLGGVKTGSAITDTTGYTAVAIKDGVIYYKDTTYSFSNLQFQQTSGTNLMTYNSQAVRTVLAGSNITFTHSNNVLTIAAKDTTYSTVSKIAAGLCPILPNETTTTKYLRQDGTWQTPPDNNTWNAMTGATSSANGTVGYVNAIPPKDGYNTKFLRADGTWSIPAYPTKSSWNYNDMYVASVSISGNNLRINKNGANTDLTIPYATSAGSTTYARYMTCPDTRSTMPAPTEYTATTTGVSFDFKQSSVTGLSGYTGVMTFRPYGSSTDWSGGAAHQLGFCGGDNRLYHRTGTSSWSSTWNKIAYTSDIPSTIAWENVTGKPNTFTPSSHTHDYLPNNSTWIPSSLSNAGMTRRWGFSYSGACMGWASNNSEMYVYTDGAFYQREGAYMCLDTGNWSSYCAAASHTHSYSQITDGTSSSTSSGWSHILSNTYGGSQKSILYTCHGGGYGMHLRGYSDSASVYMLEIYNSSKQVFAVWGDGHSTFGGNISVSGSVTINTNTYPSLTLNRTDSSTEVSMYFKNATAGWAIGINPWGIGGGQFGIGQYSGTGSSTWRFKIDNNGYCFTSSYLNLGAGNEKNASSPPYVLGFNGSDTYIRSYQTSYLSVNYANSAGYASSAGSVTNAVNLMPENTAHYFRDSNNGSWRGGMFWGSGGTESMSFVAANSGTRFQFVCGSDIAGWNSSTWSSVNPTLTIRSGEIHAYNCYFVSKRTDSGMDGNGFTVQGINRTMSFAIGSGNVNRGIYDSTAGKWILMFDENSTHLDFGNVYAPNYYVNSDRNKKHNIRNFSEHIRLFTLNDTGKDMYGVVAQEVAPMFREGEEGHMTVNYSSVLAYYVGILENKNKELEGKVSKLESEIEYLKSKIN